MSKMPWNKFTTKYPKAECFGASVSKALPKNLKQDKKGKILPTPFKLLSDWVGTLVSGDWTANSSQQVIKIVAATDVAKVIDTCGAEKLPQLSNPLPGCSASYRFDYRNRDYVKVAIVMGYDV
jgi:hypothetical protein